MKGEKGGRRREFRYRKEDGKEKEGGKKKYNQKEQRKGKGRIESESELGVSGVERLIKGKYSI